MRQRYDAGDPVSFGALTMKCQSVTMGGLWISLTAVKKFEVDEYGWLHVRWWSGDAMELGRVDEVENFFLFWDLVTDVLQDMHSTGSGRTQRRDAPSSTVPPAHQGPVTSGLHTPGDGGEPPRLDNAVGVAENPAPDEQIALPPPACWRA
jgi:hypothetical protein